MLEKVKNFLIKVKDFFVTNKKKLLSLVIILAAIGAISVLSLLLLSAFGIVSFEGGELNLNHDLFDDFMNSWYGWVILIALQVFITGFLCFIPGASMAFILLIQTFFAVAWKAFALAFTGVILSSVTMYLIGRIGGYRICEKLLGEEDCKKASDLLNHKGVVYFPLMMMFPIFPDDALVMIAGTLRMSMKWFIPSIVVGRGIGVAAIIFGLSSIPYDSFTTPGHWIGFIATCGILVCAVFYSAFLFNKFLDKRSKKKQEQERENLAKAEQIYEENKEEIAEVAAEKEQEAAEIIAELKATEVRSATRVAKEVVREFEVEVEKAVQEAEAAIEEISEAIEDAEASEPAEAEESTPVSEEPVAEELTAVE